MASAVPVNINIACAARNGVYTASVVGWGTQGGRYQSLWQIDLALGVEATAGAAEVLQAVSDQLSLMLPAGQGRP